MKWIKLACASAFLVATAFADDRPNIVFLLTDDQRYDSLGATGNSSDFPDAELDFSEVDEVEQTFTPATDIYNLNRSRASFEVAGLTPGETLYVGIRPESKLGQRRIGLWRYTKDCYPDGEAFINGEPVGGEIPLTFVFRK